MPIYEYRCTACGHEWMRTESVADNERRPPECPACRSQKVEQVFSPFFAKTVRKS